MMQRWRTRLQGQLLMAQEVEPCSVVLEQHQHQKLWRLMLMLPAHLWLLLSLWT